MFKEIYIDEDNYRFTLGGDSTALDSLKTIPKKKLMEAIDKHVESLREHFEEDGWDIDANFIVEDIFYDVLGFHIKEGIRRYINAKLGTHTEFNSSKQSPVLCIPRTYVYYNPRKDKLVSSQKKQPKYFELMGIL